MRRADALALRVEDEAGDAGGMLERLELLAGCIEDMHELADAAGEQSRFRVREARDLLDPFHAEIGDVADLARDGDAAEPAIIAAADEGTRARIGREGEGRAVMRLDALPVLPVASGNAQRAVAQREGDGIAAAIPGAGDDEGVEIARHPARLQEEVGRGGGAHQSAWQLSKPRRNCGRLRLRPMKTMRLRRGSPSFHGPMKSPSAII